MLEGAGHPIDLAGANPHTLGNPTPRRCHGADVLDDRTRMADRVASDVGRLGETIKPGP